MSAEGAHGDTGLRTKEKHRQVKLSKVYSRARHLFEHRMILWETLDLDSPPIAMIIYYTHLFGGTETMTIPIPFILCYQAAGTVMLPSDRIIRLARFRTSHSGSIDGQYTPICDASTFQNVDSREDTVGGVEISHDHFLSPGRKATVKPNGN